MKCCKKCEINSQMTEMKVGYKVVVWNWSARCMHVKEMCSVA